MRIGLIAKKIGMSSLFTPKGERLPVTLLQIPECEVIAHINNGYNAVLVGFENIKEKKLSKPLKTFFSKRNVSPKKVLKEFSVSKEAFVDIGTQINVEHFVEGQYVDVTGKSLGKGFAGVMKRHNFRGLEASHGVSITHRSHGSTGGRQDPGRVFKNKKMAGHLGDEQVTIQNIKVVAVDKDNNILIVKGSVPGYEGSYVKICDAKKKTLHPDAPYPSVSTSQNLVAE